jgi:hypothetical protein
MRLPGIEMLLGGDWIVHHRLWISYGSGTVFIHPPDAPMNPTLSSRADAHFKG